jgi:NADPH:quinone reductase-like Zn-dependent oxidoreductase
MRAVILDAFDTRPAVRAVLVEPTPTVDQILVRVHTSSINPVDNAIAAGMLKEMAEHEFPVILGRDYAGTVERLGAEVSGYAVGDEVYGFLLAANPAVHNGSWAELITVTAEMSIAPKPAGVDFGSAGSAPLVGITAMTAVDALALSEGDTVLIVGATGGVGSCAVQLAVQAGATVLAPALPEDADFLHVVGVGEQIDRNADIVAAVRTSHADGVDALLDVVSFVPGGFDGALKEGARVASSNGAAGEGPGRTNVMANPSRENLDRLAGMLDAGTLKVHVQDTFDLDGASDALQTLQTAHVQGKLSIRVR